MQPDLAARAVHMLLQSENQEAAESRSSLHLPDSEQFIKSTRHTISSVHSFIRGALAKNSIKEHCVALICNC